MKSNQIEKIIADQKDAAKRLATALLAAATMAGGATVLSSCDELIPTTETSASELTGDIANESFTNDVFGETSVADTEEVTTEPVEEINYEEELINTLSQDYPEFENGIYCFEIAKRFNGIRMNYSLIAYPKGNDGNQAAVSYVIYLSLDEDTFNNILSALKLDIDTEHHISPANDLTTEEIQFLSQLSYQEYLKQYEINPDNSLEQ